MTILEKIKSLFAEQPQIQPETIPLNQLNNWIKNKEEIDRNKTVEIMEFFEKEISTLILNLEQNKNTLKKIDFNQKKAEERIKFIVKQNLEHYIANLERLIRNLKNLKIKQPNQLIKEIDTLFIDFSKRSEMNFQKATILIGKELEETKNILNNFFKETKKNLEQNKITLKIQKTIILIKEKLNTIEEINKTIQNLNQEIKTHNKKTTDTKNKINQTKKEIEEIKQSQEYKKEIQTKQEIIKKKQTLEKEFSNLKDSINFKTLTNIYHSNKKDMDLIKDYQDNFQETFEKNLEETLTTLLKSANLDSIKLKQSITTITNIKKEIKTLEENFNKKGDTEILIKEEEIKKLNKDISDINYEISRKNRKLEKTQEEKQNLIEEIRYEMKLINVIIKKQLTTRIK